MRTTVDGEPIFTYTGARDFDSAQPSIVFVHGNGLDHTVWVLQSRYFAHHEFNALAIDLPGHGRSGGDALCDISAYADWTARYLDALSIDRAALVGHSMGSLIALETAARHPERVSHLALIGTSSPMPVTDQLLDAAQADDHSAFDMINIWGHAIGHLGGHRAPGMWMMGSAIRLLERSGPGVLHSGLKACNEYQHGLDSAAKVQCPTVLVLGELDMMSPPKRALAVAQSIPNARKVMVPRCGHMLMAERPDEVLEALIDLLAAERALD